MNKTIIKNEFEGPEDTTDGNSENEPFKSTTSANRTGTFLERRKMPDRRKKLQNTAKESLAKDSVNSPTHIGYSEGLSDNPDGQSQW